MNVKLHTPKTMKTGSGFSSLKQFLLSLLATTVSIVLTFGTAAVIDYHKKNAAKKEMVMMVVSDMDKTIGIIQAADSALVESRRLQMELADHPEYFDSIRTKFPTLMTWLFQDFSEITENIFSTSIETFNTIGNVNFVNEVSSFYMARRQYKEQVLDKLRQDLEEHQSYIQSLKELMSISYPEYACDNWVYLEDLKASRDRCMLMMDVSEKDMIKFNKQRQEYEVVPNDTKHIIKVFQECDSCNTVIKQAMEKLKD